MKTWLITGASRGLGAALAREVILRGDRAVLAVRSPESVAALCEAHRDTAFAVRMDVDDPRSVESGVSQALDRAGAIDVLVNNAGRGFHGAVEEVSDEETRALFETNVFGLLRVTRAVLPHMRRRRTGHVFNVGSVAGLAGGAGTGIYCATKFALEGISEALHEELAPLGIKVTILEPGPFRTDFNGSSIRAARQRFEDYAESAGKRIEGLRASDGKQPGDPDKAARMICDVAAMEAPPLHLVLGSAALSRARSKIEALSAEMARWEARSRATGFDETVA